MGVPVAVGNDVTEATVLGVAKKKALLCRFVAKQTATVEEVSVRVTQKFAEIQIYDLGIYADNAGVPGTLLGHKTASSVAQVAAVQTISVVGLSAAVTEGSTYYLGFVALSSESKPKYLKEAGHEDVLEQATEWAELKESATWTKIIESSKMTIWGGSAQAGTIFNFRPPTLHSPSGLYKPFPGPEAPPVITAEIVFGKATGTLLLTGTSKGITAQKVTGSATGALLLTGESKATVINKVLASATGALLLTGTSHGVAIQKVTASAAGALLLTGTSVAIVRNVVIGKASGTLFLLGSGHVLEPKAAVGRKVAIFIFED